MKKFTAALIAFSLLSACALVPQGAPRNAGPQSAGAAATGPAIAPRGPATSLPSPMAAAPQDRQCLARLTETGAQFVPVADAYIAQGCSTVGTVQLSALRSDTSRLALSNIGPVQCGVGAAFAAWARYGVDRAARQILGSPLQRIETMGSYACRNVAGSDRRSAHATAGAIDVAAFVLEDGRRISVLQHWHAGTAAEKEFLRTVQRSACRRFATVLGPEYNTAHRDHFHVEGVIQGNSFCR